jgi:hypothetical protein
VKSSFQERIYTVEVGGREKRDKIGIRALFSSKLTNCGFGFSSPLDSALFMEMA